MGKSIISSIFYYAAKHSYFKHIVLSKKTKGSENIVVHDDRRT